jgi:hypothetical protein
MASAQLGREMRHVLGMSRSARTLSKRVVASQRGGGCEMSDREVRGERAPSRLMGDLRASTGCGWGSRTCCISCLQELADRMIDGRPFGLSAVGGAGVPVQLAARRRAVAWTGSAAVEASRSGMGRRCGIWPCGHRQLSRHERRSVGPIRSRRASGRWRRQPRGCLRRTANARSCAARRRTRQRVCQRRNSTTGQCPVSSATTGASASAALAPTTK